MSGGFAGRHILGFGDLNIDTFLEVQNKRYSQILYLIDYVIPAVVHQARMMVKIRMISS